MNSNTLFRIFGCFVLSLCVLRVHVLGDLIPSVGPTRRADREIGTSTGMRGAIKPVDGVTGIPTIAEFDNAKAVVADDPAITTAELAKEAVAAQAKIAETQENNAATAKKVAGEKAGIAKGGIVDVQAATTKAQKASEEAKLAKTAAEALIKVNEATKEVEVAVEKAKIVEDAAKIVEKKAKEAEEAYKATELAFNIAEVRAKKAEELDNVDKKPTAKAAKDEVSAIEKLVSAAKISSVAATEFAVAGKDAKTLADKLVKEAEGYKIDASTAAKAKQDQEKPTAPTESTTPTAPTESTTPTAPTEPTTPTVPTETTTPTVPTTPTTPATKETTEDKPKKPEMNYVKDDKYEYFDQLLKEDRCSDDDKKTAKCKKFSNCYLDHTKPVCICFPGYTSEDASKNACTKVDKPTCQNEANTCHRNANCKENKTLGIGCQCKEDFAGDGLLCSSAFSYFINFFLVLAVVSVQLYM